MHKTASVTHVPSDRDYAIFEDMIRHHVKHAIVPFFTTDVTDLFAAYLACIPEEQRQHYRCHCCRRFIEKYGGLVHIDQNGNTLPVLWDVANAPSFFAAATYYLFKFTSKAKVTGVFVNGEAVWGTPQTGLWSHLSGIPAMTFQSPLWTAEQKMSELKQDYITLRKGLAEIPMEAVVQALRVLEADAVDRTEKTLGVARWLLALHRALADAKGRQRDNLIWRAVATAPPGYCHVRSTMISTLLGDVVAGLPFEAIKARWDAKMHPLRYQRPQAAPKEGNIIQANKIMAKLQSEGSLGRRFARLEEVIALWRRVPLVISPPAATSGVFDHLSKSKGTAVKEVQLPAKPIGWAEFSTQIMPIAYQVEVNVPAHGPFFGLVTAVNPEAPPILQWDGLEGFPRNPVSHYFWHGGSPAFRWGLTPGWNQVAAICLKPCHWQVAMYHKSLSVFFIIEAARESQISGNALFPENLRSEYHGIRSVIEAYSQSATIADKEHGNANGLSLSKDAPVKVRVKTKTGLDTYTLSL